MLQAVRQALGFFSFYEKFIYFSLVAVKALSGILDVVGIALIGLIAGLASSSLGSGKTLVIAGISIPAVSETDLLYLVLVVLAVFILKATVAISTSRAISQFLSRIETAKAVEVLRYIFGGDLARMQRFSKGEMIWNVTTSTNVAFGGILTSISTFITEGVLLILVATTFALIDPLATIFVFAYFGVVILIIQFVIGQTLKRAAHKAMAGSVETTTTVEDLISAYREISILNKKQHFYSEFHNGRVKLSSANATMQFLSGMPRYVVETSLMLGVVIFVGFQFVTGQLATGLVTIGVFLTGGVRIMASLLPLQGAASVAKNQAIQAAPALEILSESKALRQAESEVIQRKDVVSFQGVIAHEPTPPESNEGLGVEIKDVSFTYDGATEPALENIDLTVSSGQHVAIIGPSGAGKTTLVDLVLGLIRPSSGSVRLLRSGGYLTQDDLEGQIAYVPQNPGIISGTIAENVAIGIPASEIDEDRILSSLKRAHLGDLISAIPGGIHASVGNQADSLSGGQIQRLGLARALYGSPKLIVLDEATSALDASAEAAITEGIRSLGAEVTVIVIAHRLSTVQHSDRVFVMERGTITASGSFEELRQTVPMVAEYVRLMSFD